MNKFALLVGLFLLIFSACSQQKPVKLGFIGGLTGPASELGHQSRNGVMLAVEEWNAKGGAHGFPIQVIYKDDQNNASLVPQIIQDLIESRVELIIGPTNSAIAVVAAPLASESEILMFGTSVSTDLLSNIDDYFLRAIPATRKNAQHTAEYVLENVSFNSFVTINDKSNLAYTGRWIESFIERITKSGKNHLHAAQFDSDIENSLDPIYQELDQIDADVIVVCANPADTAYLTRYVRTLKPDNTIVTCEWSNSELLIKLAGGEAEGIISPQFAAGPKTRDSYAELERRFERRFKKPMLSAGFIGYVTANTVIDALIRKPEKQHIRDYLLAQQTLKSDFGYFRVNEFGDEANSTFHIITQVRNGVFIVVDE